MLEVRDIQFFPDGRSIVDTVGGRRFKVIERGVMDGYNTAKVEFLEDKKVPEDQVQGGWKFKFKPKSKIQIQIQIQIVIYFVRLAPDNFLIPRKSPILVRNLNYISLL